MSATVAGVYWKANYGEISDRPQFRIGRTGSETWDADFPISELSDLITVLQAVPALATGVTQKGVFNQAKKVYAGFFTDVVIEPRYDTGTPPQIMQFGESLLADLTYTLQLLATALSTEFPDDWDFSDVPIALSFDKYGQPTNKIAEGYVEDLVVGLLPAAQDSSTAALIANPASATSAQLSTSYVRSGKLVFNARDYGALPSAHQTVNTAAIQGAVSDAQAAAALAGTATVLIPAGSYKTNAAIIISASGITIEGSGAELEPLHDGDTIRIAGTDLSSPVRRTTIRGLKILGTAVASNQRGITADFAMDSVFERNYIATPGNNGITIRECRSTTIRDNFIEADDYGIFQYRCHGSSIMGNHVKGGIISCTIKSSLDLGTTEDVATTIIGNVFYGYGDHGVTAGGLVEEGIVRGLTIVGNIFRNSTVGPSDASGVEMGTESRGVSIIGNQFVDSGNSGIVTRGYGHIITGNVMRWVDHVPLSTGISLTDGSTCIGNQIFGAYRGIVSISITDVIIAENLVDSPANYGIHVNNTTTPCQRVAVRGNRVIGGTRGIYEQATGGVDNSFYYNHCTGASTANYGFVTPGSKRAFNVGDVPAVVGAKGGNAALTSLIASLVTAGIITDSTT